MDKSVSELQQPLGRAAKADKSRRFHSLYDKLYRDDVLGESWKEVRANKGTAGIDGKTIEDVEMEGVQAFLSQIAKELKEKTYTPSPLRRVWIPKANGKKRGLAIPTLTDRVVQTAARLVLEPIFEQGFEPNSYGFRQGKSAHDAVGEVVKWLNFGYENVIDADIASCFDAIPKGLLMKQVARRVVDGSMLNLVKQWLHSGILDGGVVVDSAEGTPQGSPISPLLANIFLDQLDKAWNESGMTARVGAHLVRYADDFVILGRGKLAMKEEALGALDKIIAGIGLSLSKDKTRLVEAGKGEGFGFLGFHFVRFYSNRKEKRVTRWFPASKSERRIMQRIRQITNKSNLATMTPYDAKDKVVEVLRGWGEYFKHSMATLSFSKIWDYACMCLGRMNRRWHQKKHVGRYKKLVSKGLSVLGTRIKAVPYAYNAAR